LANEKSTTPSVETQLAAAMAKIAELMERQTEYNEFAKQNAPRRKKTMQEYLQEKPRKRLLHAVYQNGRLVNPAGLSKETIQRLDTFATGKYCDGLLDVVRIKDGVDGISSRIHIIYNNKSIEQRMQFYMRFPTFTAIVDAVVAEMAARGIAPVMEKAADPIEDEINIGG
jgi:hypothetical protein